MRAVLRQLSTAAAIRTLPTPCRARGPGAAVARQATVGDPAPMVPAPLGVFLGLREAARRASLAEGAEAANAWGDGMADAVSEVWDLDDGFALPPPLLEWGASEFGGSLESGMSTPDAGDGPGLPGALSPNGFDVGCALEGPTPERLTEEKLRQLLAERLGARPALLPIAAAVLAGGRRFPQARARPSGQAPPPGGGRWMRFRQQRRGPVARNGRQGTRQPRRGN